MRFPLKKFFSAKTFHSTGVLLLMAAQATAASSENIETVLVEGTKTNAAFNENTTSATEISKQQLESSLAEHFQQIAVNAPGTWVSRGSGVEHLTALRSPVLTGAGACGAYLATEDGIPLFAKNLCNVNQLMVTDFKSANNVAVLRGPQSGLFGSNALFGVLNINTNATSHTENNKQKFAIDQSTLGYSSAAIDLTNHSNGNTQGLSGRLTHNNSPRDSAYHNQQFLHLYQQIEKNSYRRTDSLSLMNLEQETAGYIYGDEAYKNSDLAKGNSNPEAYRDARNIRGYSKFEWQDSAHSTSATPYFRHNEMQLLMHFVPWQPVEKNQHSSAGLQLQHTRHIANTAFTVGQDLELTSAELTEIQYKPAPFNQAAFPEGTHYDYNVTAINAGWYIRAEWQANEKLTLTPTISANIDKLKYRNNVDAGYACENPDNCRFYRPANKTDKFSVVSPALTASYQLNNTSTLYARAAQGYRTPQATELYRLQSADQIHLSHISGTSYELGLSGALHSLNYALSAYTMRVNDDILLDNERRFINNINTHHKGLEYAITWQPSQVISLNASGTHALHTYAKPPTTNSTDSNLDGALLDTAPKNMHQASVRWQASPANIWQLHWEKMGKYYTDNSASQKYEGHQLFHLSHSWQPSTNYVLRTKISNLLNTRYAERADYAFGEARYFPGLDRRLTVELSVYW